MDKNGGFGEYEGYVGNKDEFNGIIFYLKEPNTEGKPTNEFWFRRIITEKAKYYKGLENSGCNRLKKDKQIASKFKNRFEEILQQLGMDDKKLCDVVYCNVHSKSGEKSITAEYKQILKKAPNKLEVIIKNIDKKELTIFTCKDIYKELYNSWRIKKEYNDGLQYNKEDAMHYFCHIIGDKKIIVYEMLHPSRSPRLQMRI